MSPSAVHVTRDGHVCGAAGPIVQDEVSADAQGRVREVVVYVDAPPAELKGAGKKSPGQVVFDQRNCAFVPHVEAASPGTKVLFRSSDPVLHNVHAWLDETTVANFAMPVQGQEVEAFAARKPGTVRLLCDAGHDWMSAYLLVLPHRAYEVTGEGGAFRIERVPAGKRTVVAWHPHLGKVTRDVDVPKEGAVSIELRF